MESKNLRADVTSFGLPDPGDVSALRQAIDNGQINPAEIVAVTGKTHGNGLVNDYTRGYLSLSIAMLIAEKTGETYEGVRKRIPLIFSGGVEGVLSPHYTVFTASTETAINQADKALAIGVAFTPDIQPTDVGRQRQIDLTAEAVDSAMKSAAIMSPADVHFVQIKGPAFSKADIEDSRQDALPLADDPGKLMGYGRAACAMGVARALGEIKADAATEMAVLNDFSIYSSVASCSAGVEVRCNEVIVVGLSQSWSGQLTVAHAPMVDCLDVAGIRSALADIGIASDPTVSEQDSARLRATFVKCEASRSGIIRNKPHTMLNDGDIDQQRHIRAAVGGVVASVLNDTAIFVSGGAEHQGPDGGGLIALIAEKANLTRLNRS